MVEISETAWKCYLAGMRIGFAENCLLGKGQIGGKWLLHPE